MNKKKKKKRMMKMRGRWKRDSSWRSLKEKGEATGFEMIFPASVVVKATTREMISFPWALVGASTVVTMSREKTRMMTVMTMTMISNRREEERVKDDVIWVMEKRMGKERSLVSLEARNEESFHPSHRQRL